MADIFALKKNVINILQKIQSLICFFIKGMTLQNVEKEYPE